MDKKTYLAMLATVILTIACNQKIAQSTDPVQKIYNINIGRVTSLDIRDMNVREVNLENVTATSIRIEADTVIIHPESAINFLHIDGETRHFK